MNLVPYSEGRLLVPHDWQRVGRVFCIAGSVGSGYTGWAALALTPDALALCTPNGVEEIVPLWGIEDVSVVKMDGVLIERETSVGTMLSPLPYPHGIEIIYSLETRLRNRLRVVTLFANVAQEWVMEIRRHTRNAQLGDLASFFPQRR
jgi:hypothetical protein